MKRKDEKQMAEQVERYVDRAESGLDPELKRVVDSLHKAADETHPRPGFINELAQQLSAQEKTMSEQQQLKREPTNWLFGLLAGAAGVAAIALLLLYVTGILGSADLEPAVAELESTPPPQPVLITDGGQGFLGGAELQLMEPLSDEPQQITLYDVQLLASPQTEEEALEISRRFGMENGKVYTQRGAPPQLVVIDDQGRTLTFSPVGLPAAGTVYYLDPNAVGDREAAGRTLSFDEARVIAEAFVAETGLFPQEFELEPTFQLNTGVEGTVGIMIIPLLDGHPIVGQAGGDLRISAGGQIVSANLTPFTTAGSGETVTAISARQALENLRQGPQNFGYSYENASSEQGPRIFLPPAAEYQPGDEVTVTGWPLIYESLDGTEIWAQLRAADSTMYRLEGEQVAEIGNQDSNRVEVTGTLVEQEGSGTWHLSVSSWSPVENESPMCLTGLYGEDDETPLFIGDDGEQVTLAYPPEPLSAGERIEMCAGELTEPVAWLYIASPPTSEVGRSGGGGGGGGGGTQVVEVTRSVEAGPGSSLDPTPTPVPYPPAGSPSGGGGGGGGTAPTTAPDSPYVVGENVSVTGLVEGVIRVVDGERQPEISLQVDTDSDPLTPPLSYPLQGDATLLEEISKQYFTHVTIQGEIVQAREEGIPGLHNQALRVENYERTWPEQRLEAFLGHFDIQTIGGQEVTIFIDEADGQRYVVPRSVDPATVRQGMVPDRVWLAGVLMPEVEVGGLPVLETQQQRWGDSEVDNLTDASEMAIETAMPVVDYEAARQGSELGDTLVIDHVTLGYQHAGPRPIPSATGGSESEAILRLEPVWIFYGHSANGSTTFTINVPALETTQEAYPVPLPITPTPLP